MMYGQVPALQGLHQLHTSEPGHLDIQEDQVRLQGSDDAQGLRAIRAFTHDPQVRLALDEFPEFVACMRLILHEYDLDHSAILSALWAPRPFEPTCALWALYFTKGISMVALQSSSSVCPYLNMKASL